MNGDEQPPDDSERNPDGTLRRWPPWLLEGQRSATGRLTFTTWWLWRGADALPDSGLLGPVHLQPAEGVVLKSAPRGRRVAEGSNASLGTPAGNSLVHHGIPGTFPSAPEGRHLNSSGWNPENRPMQVPDPERVSPKCLRTVRPSQGREAPRAPSPWAAPTAIQVASLRDDQRSSDSPSSPEFREEPIIWTGLRSRTR